LSAADGGHAFHAIGMKRSGPPTHILEVAIEVVELDEQGKD
jgi:hypothetical protein